MDVERTIEFLLKNQERMTRDLTPSSPRPTSGLLRQKRDWFVLSAGWPRIVGLWRRIIVS